MQNRQGHQMRTLLLGTTVVALCLSGSYAGSQSAPPAAGKEPHAHAPALADMMMMTQFRHAKLWLAGDLRNWELADYQLDELKEGLEDVIKHVPVYKDMPVGQMIEKTIMAPLDEVEKAIKERDRAKFVSTFDKLTTACNSCHQATNRGFIVIQRPAASSFPNQSFAPKRN